MISLFPNNGGVTGNTVENSCFRFIGDLFLFCVFVSSEGAEGESAEKKVEAKTEGGDEVCCIRILNGAVI